MLEAVRFVLPPHLNKEWRSYTLANRFRKRHALGPKVCGISHATTAMWRQIVLNLIV